MTELPQNWIERTLDKICIITTGKKDANAAIENGSYMFFTCAAEPLKINTYIIDGEAIILPGNGANVGMVSYYRGKLDAYQRTYVLYDCKINAKYLYYYLKCYWFMYNQDKQYGSATNYIRLSNLANFNVAIAPNNEQKRIVKKLNVIIPKVDEINSRLEKIPVILKRAHQSILNQAITGELTKEWRKRHQNCISADELIKNVQENRKHQYEIACQKAKSNGNKKPKTLFLPEFKMLTSDNHTWVKCYIANIFSVETGATPLKSNESYYKNGNIPWVKTGEVQNCEIFEAEEYITEKALNETNVKLFPKDTLLVAMYGEGKTRGQVGRLKFEATTNQACAALVNTNLEYVINEYIYYYCLSQYNEIRRQASGGNQPNLNLDKIKMWEIEIPPLEEQEEIVKQVKTLFEKLDKIEEGYKKAKQYTDKITQSVLHKAFTGNLIPQDPNDKPVEII